MRATLIMRAENKDFDYDDHRVVDISVPADADLKTILEIAYSLGVSKGSFRSGTFQVQTDRGIWSHPRDRKLDPWKRPQHCIFATWEEIEAAELAA